MITLLWYLAFLLAAAGFFQAAMNIIFPTEARHRRVLVLLVVAGGLMAALPK